MDIESSEVSHPRGRILVVDDLPDNCFLLQIVLEIEGYQVEVADNGYTALELVADHPPDLVLLDVMMPGINGFDVTRQIRQSSGLPYIPILLVTGWEKAEPEAGADAGADGFIRKPVNPDNLLEQVETILNANT